MTTSKDCVWRLQQNGFGVGEVEKGGDPVEHKLVVTLDNLGRKFLAYYERTILASVASYEERLWGLKECRLKGS